MKHTMELQQKFRERIDTDSEGVTGVYLGAPYEVEVKTNAGREFVFGYYSDNDKSDREDCLLAVYHNGRPARNAYGGIDDVPDYVREAADTLIELNRRG